MKRGLEELIRLVRDRLALQVSTASPRVTAPIYDGATLRRCDATCCKGGVAISVAEKDAILAHREAVARAMRASPRPGVPRAGTRWFKKRVFRDTDFQQGISVDTRVAAGACVFLRADRLCAVHVASAETLGHPYAIKPAYCIMFPLASDKGEIVVCRGSYTRKPDCCSPVRRGRTTPLALFRDTIRVLRTTPTRVPAAKASRRGRT